MRIPAPFFSILVLAASSAVRSAMPDQPVFEKGRDIRPLLDRNEGLQAEAHRGELRERELRKTAYLAMRLDEPGEECVARDPAARACLVSVEAFNKSLESWDFAIRDRDPDFPSPEDALRERSALLKSLLDEKYFEAYSPEGRARDSLRRVFDSARDERVLAFRERRGDSAYRALYERHFTGLFQGREKRRYQALASSDSALADSLRRETEMLRKEEEASRRPFPSPPWRHLEEEDLPPELLPAAAGLRPGEVAGPIKAPYGRVFLRLHSVRRTPDLGFEDAMPALISLMHAPPRQEKRLEESVDAYYARNAADFKAPDTVLYRAWLLPESKGKGRGKKEERIREDTARVKPIAIEEASLPRILRDELELYHPVLPGELLGPIRSLLGIWYFQPLEIRKSDRRLTLAEARPRIRESLYGKDPSSPEASALQVARDKDRDLWKGLVGEYLLRKAEEDKMASGASPGGGDSAAAPSMAEAYRKLEKDKRDWMRNRLQIRHVEWSAYEPAGGMDGKENGDSRLK